MTVDQADHGKPAADNISRYLRIERLRNDVAEFLQSTIDYSEKLETDSPHWEYVFDEYARITGYENSDDLAADANFWALQANQSFADGLQAYNDLEEAHNTRRMGEKISSIIAVSSFMGSVGLRTYAKVKYGANYFSKWTYAEKMVAFRSRQIAAHEIADIYKRIQGMPNGASLDIFVERIKKLERAGESLNFDLDLWQGSSSSELLQNSLRSARWAKIADRIFTFLDIAGVVGDIGFWIYDHVQNVRAERELKGYIRELVIARFAAAQLAKINEVWENSENDIETALTVWIDHQNGADSGEPTMCYKEYHNEILAEKLSLVFDSLVGNLSLVTNQTVWDELEQKDQDRIANGVNDWLNDDPDYDEVVEEAHRKDEDKDEDEEPASNAEYTPGQPVEPLPASQINGENVAYAELTGGNGALWKIYGYFWSFQQLAVVQNQPGIRHRLSEKSRSDTTVTLQLITSNGNHVANGPELTLNTDTNEIRWANGTTFALDPQSKKNLVPTNGWTMFKAYTGEGAAVNWVNNTAECNRATGWSVNFNQGSDPIQETGFKEMTRNKNIVAATRWTASVPGLPIPPSITYPRVVMDLEAKELVYMYNEQYHFSHPMDMDLVFPRLGVD
ncbi:hypothetical protein S40293_11295 [Stachybotrys chartarum IBT 40293]|nr:hypothetical protein S40293_11295 [Stachybotrys chartarum IBT 40293]